MTFLKLITMKPQKLKYKIDLQSCDFWGKKPYRYKAFMVERPLGMTKLTLVTSGFIYAVSREEALVKVNKMLNIHRDLYDGHGGKFVVCYA